MNVYISMIIYYSCVQFYDYLLLMRTFLWLSIIYVYISMIIHYLCWYWCWFQAQGRDGSFRSSSSHVTFLSSSDTSRCVTLPNRTFDLGFGIVCVRQCPSADWSTPEAVTVTTPGGGVFHKDSKLYLSLSWTYR